MVSRRLAWLLPVLVLGSMPSLVGCKRSAPPPPTEQERTEFFAAVQEGDATIVDRLLSAKPNLANAKNDQGQTALSVAQQAGNDELAETVKRHGGR
jgi:ankyrin repeat protein